MAGVKGKSGGARPNAGRKSRSEELDIIEKLGPLESRALKALEQGLETGQYHFVRLFFEYYYGKPVVKVKSDPDSPFPVFKGFSFLPSKK